MTLLSVAAVAIGGGLGATLRYMVTTLVGRWASGPGFPWGTLTVNVLGSLLLGLLVGVIAKKCPLPMIWQTFLFVGVLGGFTTFSTFSLETVLLAERHYGLAVAYVVASVGAGVAAVFAGLAIVRWSL